MEFSEGRLKAPAVEPLAFVPMKNMGSRMSGQGVKSTHETKPAQTYKNALGASPSDPKGVVVDELDLPPTGGGSGPYRAEPSTVPGDSAALSSYMEVKSATSVLRCVANYAPEVFKWQGRKSSTLRNCAPLAQVDADRSKKLAACGGAIAIRHWIDHDRHTFQSANWCNMPRLCQACAHARGIKYAQANAAKVAHVLNDDRDLRPWLVTFTVKNGHDLAERLEHLTTSFSKGWKRRKDHARGKRRWSSFCAPEGVIYSAEIKRGANGGLWHPHLHCLCLVPVSAGWRFEQGKTGLQLDAASHRRLCDEWHEITGDSYVVNAKPLKTAVHLQSGEPVREDYLTAELMELFKYMTKPGDTSPEDVVHAWQTTIGKRLVRSYGNLVGVEVPDDLNGEPLDGPSLLMWWRWQQGLYRFHSYNHVPGVESDERTKSAT